jgi:hypothetical protein
MHGAKRTALLFLVVLGACAQPKPAAPPPPTPVPIVTTGALPRASAQSAPGQAAGATSGEPLSPAPEEAPSAGPQPAAGAAAATPVAPSPPKAAGSGGAPPKTARAESAPKAAPAAGRPPPAASPAAQEANGAASVARPPALDLASLEQRLRDTRAIGVFTKLSLKNQVDDLLAAFRAFHGGRPDPTLSQLRQRYEVLLLKVLTLLQDGDPPLAAEVSASRDAIWGILADRDKFQKI